MDPSRLRVLVEGGDDAYFVKHFLETSLGWKLDITRFNYGGGISELLNRAAKIGNVTDYEAVAIVADADKVPEKSWEKLRSGIEGASLPRQSDPSGTVVPFVRNTQLGIWLMPDNHGSGTIEHFLSQIRSYNAPQAGLSEKATHAVGQLGPEDRIFAPKDAHKAELRTWLAWQKEPGAPFGLAVALGCFDLRHPLAVRFADWFRRLADLQSE